MPGFEEAKKEYDELLNQLSDPELISNWDKFEELNKRKLFLEKIIEKEKEINDLRNRIEENNEIIKSNEDVELYSLAATEIGQLKERETRLEEELKKLLTSGGEEEGSPKEGPQAAIIEIRAGVGGDEAALFVGDLYRMYSRYAEIKGWKANSLDSHSNEIGGLKEVIFEIKGPGVYESMKYEGGVHRVQRIPRTEKSGRIHTSTASVAVLIRPKATEIKIRPEDLKIDIAKASGPGGQNVNKRMTAVRMTHLPTGIMVKSMTERSLPQNKENALAILSAKLLEMKQKEDASKFENKRNVQIGTAGRVEKIRTYNFPQDRITDHRVKKSFHNIENIMAGNLDVILTALQSL
jgi:peptide chain release factor 1